MATPHFNDDQLILVARLYFLDGVPQAKIAELVHVSQAKVSRMLALARERGLVRISVPEYEPRDPALEGELRTALGVESVVTRAFSGLEGPELRRMVGYFAAPILGPWLAEAGVVAIAGGRTIQAFVENARPSDGRPGPVMVQAMGNVDATPGPYDASELARALARSWGSDFLTLNAPALLPDAATCRRLLELDSIRHALGRLEGAGVALVGVGTLTNSVFVERKVLGAADLAALEAAGAVGEILGRFFDRDGRECQTPLRDRVVSLGLDRLGRVPRAVGVVAGSDRTGAILAAIRGGLLKALVIDQAGAAALLAAARGRAPDATRPAPGATALGGRRAKTAPDQPASPNPFPPEGQPS